jgi:hypothetical protein
MFIAVSLVLLAFNVSLVFNRFPRAGWDYRVYAGAVHCLHDGKDPYFVSNLASYSGGRNLSFVYPPLSIALFSALICTQGNHVYFLFWMLLLALTFLIVERTDTRGFSGFLLLVLFATAFLASYWNFQTGNIGLVELFLFSGFYYGICKDKLNLAALFLAVVSFLKITPFIFLLAFLFLDLPARKKVLLLLLVPAYAGFLHALSFVLYPDITPSYFLQVLGRIPGQHSPLYEPGGMSTPSSLLLCKDLGALAGLPYQVLYGLFATGLALLLYAKMRGRRFERMELLSLLVLFCLLLMPRLKPYSFAYALLPAYYLLKRSTFLEKTAALLVLSFVPLILYLVHTTSGHMGAGWVYENAASRTILHYGQLCALFVLFTWYLFRQEQEDNATEDGEMSRVPAIPG